MDKRKTREIIRTLNVKRAIVSGSDFCHRQCDFERERFLSIGEVGIVPVNRAGNVKIVFHRFRIKFGCNIKESPKLVYGSFCAEEKKTDRLNAPGNGLRYSGGHNVDFYANQRLLHDSPMSAQKQNSNFFYGKLTAVCQQKRFNRSLSRYRDAMRAFRQSRPFSCAALQAPPPLRPCRTSPARLPCGRGFQS